MCSAYLQMLWNGKIDYMQSYAVYIPILVFYFWHLVILQ